MQLAHTENHTVPEYAISDADLETAHAVSNFILLAKHAVADIPDYDDKQQETALASLQYSLQYLGDMADKVANCVHDAWDRERVVAQSATALSKSKPSVSDALGLFARLSDDDRQQVLSELRALRAVKNGGGQ